MKQLLLCLSFALSLAFQAQNQQITTISFNPYQELKETDKELLDNTYFNLNDFNNHYFNLIAKEEKSNYKYAKLFSIARNRAEKLQAYYLNVVGLDPNNVKIEYGGEFPRVWLQKPKSIYTASGEIILEKDQQQCYSYNPATEKVIYSNNGNTYSFTANAFETLEGNLVTSGNINICLWEFVDKKSLIYSNLTTHAGDKMLETAGSFYIEATQNGKKLRLAKGTNYNVKIPTTQTHKDMFTYYGNTQDGIIDWEVDKSEPAYLSDNNNSINQPTQRNVEVIMTEDEFGDPTLPMETWDGEWESDEAFYQLTAGKLGWINCDRFYDVKNTSILAIKVDSKEPVSVRIVFRDINSVLPCYSTSNQKGQYTSSKIPTGEKVLLLAYSVKNDNAILGYKEVVIGENKSETITLSKLTKTRFESAVSELIY